jgi:hypothetical protein
MNNHRQIPPSAIMSQQISRSDYLTVERLDNIFLFTMTKAPENRLNVPFCNELIQAYRKARALLGQNSEGAVILKGNDTKFFCTVLLRYLYHSRSRMAYTGI